MPSAFVADVAQDAVCARCSREAYPAVSRKFLALFFAYVCNPKLTKHFLGSLLK